jgi:tRNA U34 5-carboxymethylaminomethyl modifying GTPase MnmE/TrmE
MGNLNETPSANRLHIGIYGKTNSGKSSLINAVTKQEVSIVADVAGTTTKADGNSSARTVRDY